MNTVSQVDKYFKYADDAYLVVPGRNAHTIDDELKHRAEWAARNNLKLNPSKTSEMVICKKGSQPPPPKSDIQRLEVIKMLGVHVDNKLTFTGHIDETLAHCCQSLYALKTMRNFGMESSVINNIFKSVVLSKLLYASLAWWGYLSAQNKERLAAFVRKAVKFGYYSPSAGNVCQLQDDIDKKLFASITQNNTHICTICFRQQK